ncbi:hypothetical protein [Zavarzinia sp. CC-PAN008]|uniref:hypothetical protein n=1 Tax=Zavarzinia sp. CC-PAN008 TaxID=3243332 RepID=UPI003F745093
MNAIAILSCLVICSTVCVSSRSARAEEDLSGVSISTTSPNREDRAAFYRRMIDINLSQEQRVVVVPRFSNLEDYVEWVSGPKEEAVAASRREFRRTGKVAIAGVAAIAIAGYLVSNEEQDTDQLLPNDSGAE